jgi:hypothetical protein
VVLPYKHRAPTVLEAPLAIDKALVLQARNLVGPEPRLDVKVLPCCERGARQGFRKTCQPGRARGRADVVIQDFERVGEEDAVVGGRSA